MTWDNAMGNLIIGIVIGVMMEDAISNSASGYLLLGYIGAILIGLIAFFIINNPKATKGKVKG